MRNLFVSVVLHKLVENPLQGEQSLLELQVLRNAFVTFSATILIPFLISCLASIWDFQLLIDTTPLQWFENRGCAARQLFILIHYEASVSFRNVVLLTNKLNRQSYKYGRTGENGGKKYFKEGYTRNKRNILIGNVIDREGLHKTPLKTE